jgi:cytochrome c-type biogenesis protein CcmF
MEIQYIGEQLIWEKIGNLLVVLTFTASLFTAFSYLKFFNTGEVSWRKIARKGFAIQASSIIGIFLLLFYLIFNHRFEYYYVWEHSNTTMPLRYILSCFWEGQEGSFLLWMFWHSVLSMILIRTAGEWEGGVMFIISLVQAFLATMILGIVIFNHKIGTNPFVLLREHPDFSNLPFIKLPDYLSKLNDGRGLNPLLQNYWMTIHPPTLFLGFALTVVPFAYAMSALMKKKLTEWIQPALQWTFAGVMILGTGILMGAAWAYESLSFGGFWAWDPVENASLVPWMTLTAGAHAMLIYKHRQKALLSVFILLAISFILILYSTFLTRSGILGDSSVHAFTDLGMTGQLVIYMLFFLALTVVLMFVNRKELMEHTEEEHFSSREFWMFIGILVLVIGSIQITFTTSTPVINKLFGTKLAPPTDPIDHYNQWQVPVAIFICLLIGIGQFFRYKKSDWKLFWKKITVSIVAAVIITGLSSIYFGQYPPHYYALFFASVFASIANLDYFIRTLKGKLSNAGASFAHLGFALLICGALISNSKKEVISRNVKNIDLGRDMPNKENILIEQKTDTLPMGEYYVTYSGKEKEGIHVYYNISYFSVDKENGRLKKEFDLKPFVQLNERMGNVAEPATKHFLTRDIYTHITYADLENNKNAENKSEYSPAKKHEVAVGDTFVTSNSFVIFQELNKDIDRSHLELNDSDLVVGAKLLIEDINRTLYPAEPLFMIKDFSILTQDAEVQELGLKFTFDKIDPATGKIQISVSEKISNKKDFVIMKAIIFPGINILWIGCLLLIFGTMLSLIKRYKKRNSSDTTT